MKADPARPEILVIDDEVQIRRLLRLTLEPAGYRLSEAGTGQLGLTEAATRQFDAIILDVDNGASGLTAAANSRLYSAAGLSMARSALRPGGCLAVWSANADPAFVQRMGQSGFTVTVERARTHPTGGSWNSLFIGRIG